jgi:hypothetical protein
LLEVATMSGQSRPAGICPNCYATWRARRPRPTAVYCHHLGNAARPTVNGWQILESISARDLAALRAEGLL